MAVQPHLAPVSPSRVQRKPAYKPGDLVTTATGYPVLFEILTIDQGDSVRVRGLNWAPGYSATIGVAEIRPVTGILTKHKS